MAPAELKSRGNMDAVEVKEHTSVDWPIWSNLFALFGSSTSNVTPRSTWTHIGVLHGIQWSRSEITQQPMLLLGISSLEAQGPLGLMWCTIMWWSWWVSCNILLLVFMYMFDCLQIAIYIYIIGILCNIHLIIVVVTGSCSLPVKCFGMVVII